MDRNSTNLIPVLVLCMAHILQVAEYDWISTCSLLCTGGNKSAKKLNKKVERNSLRVRERWRGQ